METKSGKVSVQDYLIKMYRQAFLDDDNILRVFYSVGAELNLELSFLFVTKLQEEIMPDIFERHIEAVIAKIAKYELRKKSLRSSLQENPKFAARIEKQIEAIETAKQIEIFTFLNNKTQSAAVLFLKRIDSEISESSEAEPPKIQDNQDPSLQGSWQHQSRVYDEKMSQEEIDKRILETHADDHQSSPSPSDSDIQLSHQKAIHENFI